MYMSNCMELKNGVNLVIEIMTGLIMNAVRSCCRNNVLVKVLCYIAPFIGIVLFCRYYYLKGKTAYVGHPGKLDWWQRAIIYQIYPRSFQDSNGDGIGDINGIASRLDHFVYLGIEAIWLSPVYKSPMKDFGYDVTNFIDIDPHFGTLEDMDNLILEAHKRGLKIIMDFIPNHTSDMHPWFLKSVESRDNPWSDFYVWHDGKIDKDGKRVPPNNWISVMSGSTWTWHEKRQQFYFHHYLKEQPDLNWRNPKVKEEMDKVLHFWLDKGVDGFRIDAISQLVEAEDATLDEPRSNIPGVGPDKHRYLDHIYSRHQQETYDIVLGWRKLFDEYEKKTGRHHIYMVTEMYDKTMKHSMKYYDYGVDYPFNFNLVYINENTGGDGIFDFVNSWLERMPTGRWPNWVMGNHDNKRITSKKGPEYASAFNVLLLLLPGTPTTYQGEEIGMENIELTWEQTKDPVGLRLGKKKYKKKSRDPCRSPMQWSDEKNAGFSKASECCWLPVHPNYNKCNVKNQLSDPISALNIYKALSSLRQKEAFQLGAMKYNTVNKNIFSFIRYHDVDKTKYLIAINFGKEKVYSDFSCDINGSNYTSGRTALCTRYEVKDETKVIDMRKIGLEVGEAIVVAF